MAEEARNRTCPLGTTSPVLRVPLWLYKALFRTCSAEPSRISCHHGLDIHTARLGLWGKELEKEGRGRFKNSSPLIFAAVIHGAQASPRPPSSRTHSALHNGRHTGIAPGREQASGWEQAGT